MITLNTQIDIDALRAYRQSVDRRTRAIAGLLLMPPTRHNFLHLNEALRIKQRLQHGK